MFAIVVRCVILVLIGIALPVLAVNKIFFQPSRASVYSRVIASQYSAANPAFQFEINGNVVLIMPQSNEYPMSMSVTATSSSTPFHCNTYGMTLSNPPMPSHAIENRFTIATCPLSWAEINSIDVSITFSQLGGAPYGIYPGVGDFNDIVMFTQPIPVLAAFNLFAYMTWTSRQLVFTHSGFLSLFNTLLPGRNVQHMEIYSLFPVPGSGPITTTSTPSAFDLSESTTTVNMTIVQRESFVTKFVQEFTDATALDGLSSMGGLWTTIDAIFTILFGASVLYFAFGKRPLSPLGIVHTFQNRTLTRNWHEDFPAIRTEGGEPGSDNAGVVAFLRDRWLDIAEEDDRDAPGRNKEGELVAPWV
ncbi:hypothetical protein C8F01DRAFT_33819 [Mycena amicta]|nr:hypothetical protein C8F01DRAFT_33819 [Mycena amicta]